MTSLTVQYILVFAIIGAVIIWILVNLLKKGNKGISCNCTGCSLAESCKKKEMRETTGELPASCSDCPSEPACPKKGDVLSCGNSVGTANRRQ